MTQESEDEPREYSQYLDMERVIIHEIGTELTWLPHLLRHRHSHSRSHLQSPFLYPSPRPSSTPPDLKAVLLGLPRHRMSQRKTMTIRKRIRQMLLVYGKCSRLSRRAENHTSAVFMASYTHRKITTSHEVMHG